MSSSNGKGHGVHSPFVFDFITKVLNDKKAYSEYKTIENRRKELLSDQTSIDVQDLGAGSSVIPFKKRVVKDIASSSLKTPKFSQLLFRIANYYKPQTVIELGTSLGITSSYLAKANPDSKVYTFEGADSIAAIAQQTFDRSGVKNIELIKGNFDNTLPPFLQTLNRVDLAFVDGNHKKQPTLRYFEWLLKKAGKESILVFDDIHWSMEMEEAWKQIKAHPSVTLSIDLFFIGLVFLNGDFKEKQHFAVRF
jgi:predicted O-methyltransferase YrrM